MPVRRYRVARPEPVSLPGEEELAPRLCQLAGGKCFRGLAELRVLVDCANGAATAEAPELFRGAQDSGDLSPRFARWTEHQ